MEGCPVPEKLIEFSKSDLESMLNSEYKSIAKKVFSEYLTDYTN